jgi:hypothetical protein
MSPCPLSINWTTTGFRAVPQTAPVSDSEGTGGVAGRSPAPWRPAAGDKAHPNSRENCGVAAGVDLF